jgi:tetratricopeptide (TPR) repeat protein
MSLGVLALALFGLVPRASAGASDAQSDLMQDLSKANLNTLSHDEEKRRFMNTITVEKMRIQHSLLQNTFDSALELYHAGNYEGASELAARILAIDPSFEDAAMLRQAAGQLKGSPRSWSSEMHVVDQRFKEGLDLYQQNRLVEAQKKFEEVTELSPTHLKARYWLHRVQGELADVHYARGEEAYAAGEYQKTLDHWYAALLLNPSYPKLVDSIQKVEEEKRKRDANRLMQTAVGYVGKGDIQRGLDTLNQVLQLNPGDSKAQAMLAEIKNTAAMKNIADGDKLFKKMQFEAAIKEWDKARQWGYDADKLNKKIAAAKENERRIEDAKQKKAEDEEKRREAAEAAAKKKAEEAAARKAKEEEEGASGENKPAGTGEGGDSLSFKLDTNTPGDKKDQKPKEVDGKKVIDASGATQMSAEQQAKVTQANKQEALQHYQQGMVYMQNRQLDQAKHELDTAKKLDPSNLEIDAALRRIDAIVQGQ